MGSSWLTNQAWCAATFPRADPKPTILNPTHQPGSNLLHLIPRHHPAGGAHPPGHGVAIAADVLGLEIRIRIKICEERQDLKIVPTTPATSP